MKGSEEELQQTPALIDSLSRRAKTPPAHVYRKFEKAEADHPEANPAMKWIGQLYDIDDRAEGDLAKKAELRASESAEVIATMKTWLWSQATLKTLSIGNAAAYVVANWDRLTRFLDDARIPLDDNGTERAIRGPQESLRLEIAARYRPSLT